ncbi:arsenate reductase/ArsR family transcriptional regulator [Agromyces ramosus]|jgi:protein-tyrosine-phosphatase/DNA-binding transcriptional ArsR family regulator|uniref:Arsenate reductase/ArsR family transcriptional regulator n=1 Tax=Agromyces ramosus TaxID=33879 RepID=A0A4Q7MBJ9_9MICO|nr:metalloregulator ArsR/SmtB family transcription factor [Agromyces ramosus]RZS63659.1 arsenate reductase/ArsR family transcriptional regulator [Agromyces ramosus]
MSANGAARDFRLLTDPTRMRILGLIQESPDGRALVGRLATELGLTQPTVSHHVKALHDAGVLDRAPEGRLAWYSIAPAAADRVRDVLQTDAAAHASAEVLARVASDLADRFEGVFSPETVGRYVRESHDLLVERSGLTRYVPSRTAAFAAERLEALASEQAPHRGVRPEVLFVCVQNSGRSQLAAALLRQLAGDRVRVHTAGSAPASEVRSTIVAALDEVGVPLGGEFPKPLTDEVVRAADVVVTMGCGDACPVYPGRRYLDWELDDPAELPLARVREIRDDIEGRVRTLIDDLAVNAA